MSMQESTPKATTPEATETGLDFEVIVVGAGVAGLYLLHRLRTLGLTATALEAADDVGGTWYWNRYPGARCDIETVDYSYSFDAELEQEWEWSERYATQPEILRYLQHVAERHDLRRDIQFETRVESAQWNDTEAVWQVETNSGDTLKCRWFIMATGCLSQPKDIDIAGADSFAGESYSTSRWPHEGVDFTGKRVAVIGTGSSGIQSIPLIAKEASELTVFQRTANFSIPARNGSFEPERLEGIKARYPEYREEARWSRAGVTMPEDVLGAQMMSPEERTALLDAGWDRGNLIGFLSIFSDTGIDAASNQLVVDYVHDRIRSIVDDPATATALCPTDHPFGTKRLCLDSDYYPTFNEEHVHLVDLKQDPITAITPTGIQTELRSFDFDAIVYATGFDAMTGAIVAVDIRGRDGVTLSQRWADGPVTYLGLSVEDFPNFFSVTGPQSPSVLSNMAVSIEQHVEWITDTIGDMRTHGWTQIEPTNTAVAGWQQHSADCADLALMSNTDSWYTGANVPGKPRVVLPYLGGVGAYRQVCNDVVDQGYLGFRLTGDDSEQCNDGVIRRIQPDVEIVLQMMDELGLPAIESMPAPDARAFMDASAGLRPPGPEVGEIVDGTFPGADGESSLTYRLYRPATPGPHPIAVYFHGGGWVLGSEQSDDPLCRELCVSSDAIIFSANYRHAPEAPFPAAVDDGFAALNWVAENAEALGASPGPIAVCGYSAGGNVAAVACQTARDAGGPQICGQVLLNPVTDSDATRNSFVENADGYVLTASLMAWFWDQYCEPAQRDDPRAAPLRSADLSNLPPAVIFTADFDPLRDEGVAYVDALNAAGTPARHVRMRGQVHTSIGSVGMIISANGTRAGAAAALADMLDSASELSLDAPSSTPA